MGNQDDIKKEDLTPDAEASSQPGLCPYPIGATVLAKHKGCFYEANVKKVELRGNKWEFFIHYRGWNKHWDEWVGLDRTMEYTDENRQTTTNFNKNVGTEKIVKAGRVFQRRAVVGDSSKKLEGDAPDINQKKKRKHVQAEESTEMEKSTNVFIPPALRKQLIDDFEFVKSGKLVKLPRSPNVEEILIKYRDYRKEKDGVISVSVEEVLSGLHAYFDKALPVLLLYNKERQQYQQATSNNVSPSKIYGAEHLLRLFVKLPKLLCNLIEEDTLIQLQQNLQEVLKFLRKNHDNFFLSSYHVLELSETSPKRDGAPCVVNFQAVDASPS